MKKNVSYKFRNKRRYQKWLLRRNLDNRLFHKIYELITNNDVCYKAEPNDLQVKVQQRHSNGSVTAYVCLMLTNFCVFVGGRKRGINKNLFYNMDPHISLKYAQTFGSYAELHMTSLKLTTVMMAAKEHKTTWGSLTATTDRGVALLRPTCELTGLAMLLQSTLPGGLQSRSDNESRLHISVRRPW